MTDTGGPEPAGQLPARPTRTRRLRVVQKGEQLVSTGGWQSALVLVHLEWHLTRYAANPPKKWCSVSCMAKTMLLRDSPENREKVRRRINGTFRWGISRRDPQFIAIAYNSSHHGRIEAFKLYEGGDELNAALRQARRMRATSQLKEEQYQLVLSVLGLSEP